MIMKRNRSNEAYRCDVTESIAHTDSIDPTELRYLIHRTDPIDPTDLTDPMEVTDPIRSDHWA